MLANLSIYLCRNNRRHYGVVIHKVLATRFESSLKVPKLRKNNSPRLIIIATTTSFPGIKFLLLLHTTMSTSPDMLQQGRAIK